MSAKHPETLARLQQQVSLSDPTSAFEAIEQTAHGLFEVSPYRSTENQAVWTFGIGGLMTGMRAYFLIRGQRDGQPLGAR